MRNAVESMLLLRNLHVFDYIRTTYIRCLTSYSMGSIINPHRRAFFLPPRKATAVTGLQRYLPQQPRFQGLIGVSP